MLPAALGYDPQIEQLVGNSWAINVSKLALGDADLDDGMEEIALSVNLTREQAAQMAFNAMQATLVEYEDNGGKIELARRHRHCHRSFQGHSCYLQGEGRRYQHQRRYRRDERRRRLYRRVC